MTGKELKIKRNDLGLTQESLAIKLGVAANTIARWERNEMKIPPFLHLALKTIENEVIKTIGKNKMK